MRKVAIIECDKRDKILPTASVFKYTENGELFVKTVEVKEWSGQFLRYFVFCFLYEKQGFLKHV